MIFSKKSTLPLWILCFACSFLIGSENLKEYYTSPKYHFYEKEDCIKVKIVLSEGVMAQSSLRRIDSPDIWGIAAQIRNDSLKYLETYYQLVNVEINGVAFPEQGGVMFEIKENLEREPSSKRILRDKYTITSTCFIETDKQVDLRDDVNPRLTVSKNSPYIKYVRFFTKP
ncbi:MAG: hypothetical protein S4CHLAM37_04350 [Chlamydiia bacterium]|nr:hypothetical protein [Chlamydiia bacterium]